MPRAEEPAESAAMVRAAAEVLVFAPLGFGIKLVEDAPSAVGRVRQELSNARFIGRLTVTQGVAQVRSKLDAESAGAVASSTTKPAERTRASAADDVAEVPASPRVAPSGDTPLADELALPDYDTLPAIDIVTKLETLSADERNAIERYESAHRQRRTVLGKLAQLAEQ